MLRKGFIALPILIFAAAVAVGAALYFSDYLGFVVKNTTVDNAMLQNSDISTGETVSSPLSPELVEGLTAGWQTYRNEKYGFEVKYPEGWTVKEEAGFSGRIEFRDNTSSRYSAFPSVSIRSAELTLEEIKEYLIDSDCRDLMDPSIIGYDALLCSYNAYSDQLIIIHNGKEYSFFREDRPQDFFSTFRFVSSTDSGAGEPAGKFCGGIAPGAFPCPEGYECKLDGTYPDAGGHCVVTAGRGILSGTVTIGPNCPVEREDMPCPTSPEAYAAREFTVTQNGKTITTFHANASGTYSVSLSSGTYTVLTVKSGIGYMSGDLPAIITIKAGETTTQNIDIDTGIR